MKSIESPEIIKSFQYQPERACIYLARTSDQQLVVIKDSSRMARFHHEVEVYRRLSTASREKAPRQLPFPQLLDINEEKQRLVIEYVQGVGLHEILSDNERFPLTTSQRYVIAKKTVQAIQYFNSHGIAHLDEHPANIMYNFDNERLVLFDYDLALLGNTSLSKITNDHARSPITKNTFYLPNVPGVTIHAPELTKVGTIDGIAADKYATACSLIQICWGFQPLVEASKENQTQLNIPSLRAAIKASPQFNEQQESLLEQLLINLSFDPKKRKTDYRKLESTLDTLIAYEKKGIKSKSFSTSRRAGM